MIVKNKYISLPEVLNNTAKLVSHIQIQIPNYVPKALCVFQERDLKDRTIQHFQNCCVVFDDLLDSNQNLIDPFFTRGTHNDLDVYYLSQSYFDLPKRTIRIN